MNAGSSPIPSRSFLGELRDDELRDGFVSDHVRTRLALLIRSLREQRGWSQTDLANAMGTTQSVISRLEDPDYGKLTLRTLFEVAAAFKLPLYIDMPDWEEWFRLMEDMSSRNLQRDSFDADHLGALASAPVRNAAVIVSLAPTQGAGMIATGSATTNTTLFNAGGTVYQENGTRNIASFGFIGDTNVADPTIQRGTLTVGLSTLINHMKDEPTTNDQAVLMAYNALPEPYLPVKERLHG